MTHRCTSLVLKVEIIAGTSDEQAAVELQMLATDMGTLVEAQQRETTMRAFPGQNWAELSPRLNENDKLEATLSAGGISGHEAQITDRPAA